MKPRTLTIVVEVETDRRTIEVKRLVRSLLGESANFVVRQVQVAVVDATKKKGGAR